MFLDYDEARKGFEIPGHVFIKKKEMNSERYPIELDRNSSFLITGYLLKPVPPPMDGRDDGPLGEVDAIGQNLGLIRRGRPDKSKPTKMKGGYHGRKMSFLLESPHKTRGGASQKPPARD
jgi:hypothetical protein